MASSSLYLVGMEPCAYIDNIQEHAWCVTHLADQLDKPSTYRRVKHELVAGHDGERLNCDLRWKGNCLVPVGVALQL
jgi:hypothetical protein